GTAPNEDLDGDGTANATDDDVDGDDVLNSEETFSYDATNQGAPLTQGQMVTLEFDTDGTPFQNGLTGALDSSKATTTEVDLAAASVANGLLTIRASGGDAYQGTNTQQNAFVSGFQAVEGMRVETRFAAPDWDANSNGVQAPINYQSAGLIIGLDQDNYIKAVFGRSNQEFEFGTEISGGASNTATDLIATNDYAAIAEVVISLEAFIDNSGAAPVAKAQAFGTLLGSDGQPLAGADTVALGAAKTLTGSLSDAVLNGTVLGAGVTQTANNNKPVFDVSYQYLKVTALGTPPPNVAPTADAIDAGIVDEAAPLVEIDLLADANAADSDGGVLDIDSVTVTDANANPVLFTLNGTSLSIDPAQFAALNGNESAAVTVNYNVTDGQGGSTPNTATLVVNGVDAAMVSISGTPTAVETGDDGVTTLVFDLVYTGDADATRTVTYTVNGGEPQNADITFPDGAATLSIDVANDNIDNDDDIIEVTLTGIGDNISDVVDSAANSATGTVTEDDTPVVSISGAPTAVESGDDGVTTLVFDLAYDGGDATRTITYTVNGGEAQNAEVIFTGGIATLSVDVANDDDNNGDDDVEVVLTAVSDGDLIDPLANSATGIVTEDDAPVATTIRIQAEDFDSSDVYATQTQGAADAGEVAFLPNNGASGSATYDLAGKGVIAGLYNITLGYFDENDGESDIEILLDGNPIGAFTLDDDATSDNAAQAASFRSKTFTEIEVGVDGQMVINATTDAGEYARIDWIEFVPIEDGGPDNTAPYMPFDMPDQGMSENTPFDFNAGALFADNEEDLLTFTATATTANGELVDDLPSGVTFDTNTGIFGGAPVA
ncbi:MAG: hypothetical protein ACR2PI_04645, partial [Hyphomicrobiaceae bacterium]